MPVAQNPDREAAPDRTSETCQDCERLTLAQAAREGRNREVERRNNAILRGAR